MDRQGFGIRLVALILDIIGLIILGFIVGLIFGGGLVISYRMGAAVPGRFMANLVGTLLALAYWSTEIFRAASPGKMLPGLRIASETGETATQNQLVTRWVVKNSGGLIMVLATIVGAVVPIFGFVLAIMAGLANLAIFIGCFFTLGTSRQALHDTIAHTAVYKVAAPAGFPVTPMGSPASMPPPPPAV